MNIPASFISRISNAKVYEKAGAVLFSRQVLKHQLQLLRKVAVSKNQVLRRDTFADASMTPQVGRYIRRVGRPRQDWTSQLLQKGREMFGAEKFRSLLVDEGKDA